MKYASYPLSCLALLLALGCSPGATPVQIAATPSYGSASVTTQPHRWLAYGDSITDDAFRNALIWQAAFPEGAPEVINSGMRGATSTNAVGKLDEVLKAYPGAQFVGVAFGTNDAYMEMPVADYKANLRTLVRSLKTRGMTPLLSTIPYSPHVRMTHVATYNEAIRDVQKEFGLAPGPDLFSWFQAHPEQVSSDQIHMTTAGSEAIQRLWAERARTLNW